MPTVKLVASSYSVTGSVTVTNPDRMYTDVSSTTYATLTHTTSGTTSYYCYIKGFNFSAVPDNANVSSITIRIRGYETGLSTSTSYAPRLYNNTSTITGASAASANFGTSASTITVPYTGTWATLKGYGANLEIRVTIRRSNRNTQGYLYIYGAEIEVTYTVPADIHVTGVSLDKQTDSIEIGEATTLTETITPSNATDKSVSWSTSDASVATVSDGVVTGVAAGTAIITVTTTDGGYTATCTVTVSSGGGGTWTTIFDDDVQIIPDSPYNYIYYSGFSGAFEADTTYRITWDGVTYTCQSQPNANTYDGYAVGNMSLLAGGTDTGEPFLLYRASWDSTVLTADTTSDAGEWGRWIHCKIEKLSGGNPPPVITVGTPSRSIISDESGVNQCVCTFTSDLALQAWEARATKGVTPARGVGLLVESGTTLAAGATGTVVVDWNELTNGDGEYTITVYGQSTDGVWSE